MSTTDTTDAPDLFRKACEVMGHEIEDEDGLTYIWSNDDPANMCTMLDDEWNILRLIVAWIEARGGYTRMSKLRSPKGDIFWSFVVFFEEGHPGYVRGGVGTGGKDYPDAAARWVCEHGRKIAEETT